MKHPLPVIFLVSEHYGNPSYWQDPLSGLEKHQIFISHYILDCGCIHYQRVFRDGNLDPQTGIYRNAEDGACEICMLLDETWRDRVID